MFRRQASRKEMRVIPRVIAGQKFQPLKLDGEPRRLDDALVLLANIKLDRLAAIEQIQPDTLAEILSKRIGYAKWNLIRLRFNGGAASFFARACLRCLLFPAAAALALLQALCWCTETGDPAALWHVPVETLMSFLYPFLAARYAFGPVPPEAR